MTAGVKRLAAAELKPALRAITGWRQRPGEPVNCPACGAPGLQIIDRSARPYAEWYALTCAACDLDDNIHIPLGTPQAPSD